MTEKNNVFSEMIPNKRSNKEKLQTKLFTIELIRLSLLLYCSIS